MNKSEINTLMLLQAVSTSGTVFLRLYYPFFLLEVLGLTIAKIALLATFSVTVGLCIEFIAGMIADKLGHAKTILAGTLFEIFGLIIFVNISLVHPAPDIAYRFAFLAAAFLGLSATFWPGYYALLGKMDAATEGAVFPKLNIVWKWASLLGAIVFFISANHLSTWVFLADIASSAIFTAYIVFALRGQFESEKKSQQETFPLGVNRIKKLLDSLFVNLSFLKNTTIARLALIQGFALMIDAQLYTAVPVYWKQESVFEPRYLSVIVIIHSLATIVGQMSFSKFLGKFSDISVLKIGTILIISGFFLRSTFASVPLLVVGSVITALGDMALFPKVKSMVARHTEKNQEARSMSYFYTIQNFTSMAAPSLGIIVLAFTNRVAGWSLLNLVTLVAILILLHSLKPSLKRAVETKLGECRVATS